MPGRDPTYDPNTPEQREYVRQIADQERQQRRLAQAAAEAEGDAQGDGPLGPLAAKASPTAAALQMAWRFYLPSFTLTSLYIVLHIVLRYVFQFKIFCPADQGAPLGGIGRYAARGVAATGGHKLTVGAAGALADTSTGDVGEKLWIALGLASILPLVLAAFLLYLMYYIADNPLDFLAATLTGNL